MVRRGSRERQQKGLSGKAAEGTLGKGSRRGSRERQQLIWEVQITLWNLES